MVNRTLVRDARSNHVPRRIGAGSGSRCARPKTSTARSPVAVTTPRAAPGMRAGTATATEPVAAARISAAVTAEILLAALWRRLLYRPRRTGPTSKLRPGLQLWMIVSGSYAATCARTGPNTLRSGAHPRTPAHRTEPPAAEEASAEPNNGQFIAQSGHSPPFARMPYEPFSRADAVAIAEQEWRLFGQRVYDDPPRTNSESRAERRSRTSSGVLGAYRGVLVARPGRQSPRGRVDRDAR